ncbi:hypothetical protein K466DRAFT_313877 [Polyporus arcularius HHB13444]|uniref:Secreted protein n=1 Tax=Polyporus arcularius HHB13444 TaxID=1314778 RepID=A0A5C3PPA1_9APHY|nr:hypothetical protein K466DRAFT_313877 [Polyporus arcularius HHB13444]
MLCVMVSVLCFVYVAITCVPTVRVESDCWPPYPRLGMGGQPCSWITSCRIASVIGCGCGRAGTPSARCCWCTPESSPFASSSVTRSSVVKS